MKQIITVLTLLSLSLLLTIKISAAIDPEIEKTLICISGHNYDNYLQYEGYDIIFSNVNFHLSGSYRVVYQKQNTTTTYTKKVIVKERGDLENSGYYELAETKLTALSDNERVASYVSENGFSVFVTERISSFEREDYTDLYLTLYEGSELSWQVLIKEKIVGGVKTIILDDETIVLGANIYRSGSGIDIYIATYNINGQKLQEKFFGGSGNDYLHEIIATIDSYVFVGSTNSQNGDFVGKRLQEDSYIIALNKYTLQKLNSATHNEDGINRYLDIEMSENYYYIVEEYVDQDFKQGCTRLIQLDLAFQIVKSKVIRGAVDFTFKRMLKKNNQIYLLGQMHNYVLDRYQSEIRIINDNLQETVIESFGLGDYQKESLLDITIINQKLVTLYKVTDLDTATNSYLIRIHQTEEAVINISKVTDDTAYLGFCGQKNIDIYSYDQQFIKIYHNNYLNINSDNKNDNEPHITINGTSCHYQKDKSDVIIDPSIFGIYRRLYYFSSNEIELAYYLDTVVESSTSILNNQTYDLFTVITFNGTGYLNNQKIASPYIVREIGEYQLEVIGKNGLIDRINFRIEAISNQTLPTEVGASVITFNPTVREIDDLVEPFVQYDNITKRAENTPWWYLLIPAIVIAAGLYLLKKVIK